jgi:hypothetical protein
MIATEVRSACEQMLSLDAKANEISSIVNVIQEIANQTNLLRSMPRSRRRALANRARFCSRCRRGARLAESTTLATGDIEEDDRYASGETGSITHRMKKHVAAGRAQYGIRPSGGDRPRND